MSPKKKTKHSQVSYKPDWIEMEDGSFSLVIKTKEKITAKKDINNNEFKKLVKSKSPEKCNSSKKIHQFKKPNITTENGNTSIVSEPDMEILSNQSGSSSELSKDFAALQLVDNKSSDIPKEKTSPKITKPLNGLTLNAQTNVAQTESVGPDDKLEALNDSDDSDNESFCNQLFSDSPPKAKPQTQFISAKNDTFLHEYDSDDEVGIVTTVKFSLSKSTSEAVAECDGNEYAIGFLDLTPKEYPYFKMNLETFFELSINPTHIVIRNNKLNIKRINERIESLNPNQPIASWSEILSMRRIQFSSTEPLLAKYEENIYFVGPDLHAEYICLLGRTKRNIGTAIRIRKNRIEINKTTQTIDVVARISFEKQNEICVITSKDENNVYDCDSIYYRRYIVKSRPYEVVEVESKLLHSTIHDEVTEIYAESDFPFHRAEKVQKIKKEKIKVAKEARVDQAQKTDVRVFQDSERQLDMHQLNDYAVPNDVKFLIDNKHIRGAELAATKYGVLSQKKSLRNDLSDYIEGHKMMIHIEEEEQIRYIETFNQTDIRITYYMDRQFRFEVPNIQLAGAVEEKYVERFVLIPKNKKFKREIWGQVLRLRGQEIFIEIYQESLQMVLKRYANETYDICFKLNRMPFQAQHYALDFIECENLFTKLIDNSYYKCKSTELQMPNGFPQKTNATFQYSGTTLDKLNAEQQSAVKNIISKGDKLPYVLFGPPGTGKTRTLVAAVEQIVRTTNQKILICAMSNAACDEITERLVDILRDDEIYRLYAKSYKNERISSKIVRCSNYDRQEIIYPSLKYLYQFRVLVCTLCSAGCLTRARLDKAWRANHFSYVFIDECASAPEAMCLVPIAGLCTSDREIHAKIILAGDPKQLDAVTRSHKAKRLGYNTSWLEQLCITNLYSRNATTGQFNPMYITQLVKNYRSHPAILSIPNELFYEKKLEALAAKRDIDWYINSKILPSKQFPIIFKSVTNGTCTQSIEGSCFNPQEIKEVLNVIKQLMPPMSRNYGLKQISQSDIGVVTPYRKQRFQLSNRLRHLNYDEVTVGTAEIFQGKEKPVMIISTVRTDGALGFVENEKRLNVVITRAKCLLVVIGDPHTLSLNKNWRRLIEVCIQNNSFEQGEKFFSLNEVKSKPQNQKKK